MPYTIPIQHLEDAHHLLIRQPGSQNVVQKGQAVVESQLISLLYIGKVVI